MRREEAMEKLASAADELRALGVTALYLFGSTARDEAGPDSDVDVFVDYDAERFSFVKLYEAEETLRARLERPVELATRPALHPVLKSRIEREALRVF